MNKFAVIRWKNGLTGIYPVRGADDSFLEVSKNNIDHFTVHPTSCDAIEIRDNELISRMVLEM